MKKIKEQKEIRGWLIIPILGLFVSIFALLYELTTTQNSFVGLVDVAMIILIIWTLILVFKFKKTAIAFLKIVMIVAIVTNILNLLGGSEIGASVIGNVIWLIYFYKSERVKNTFVN